MQANLCEQQAMDRQNQALAILAIATAAIGFGLFGPDWELQFPTSKDPEVRFASLAQISGIVITLFAYFLVLITSGRILARDSRVTGLELITGPMAWLVVEALGLCWIFLGNLLIV